MSEVAIQLNSYKDFSRMVKYSKLNAVVAGDPRNIFWGKIWAKLGKFD